MSHLTFDVTSYTPADGYNTYDIASLQILSREILRGIGPYATYEILGDERQEPEPTLIDLIKNYVYNLANTLSRGKAHRVDTSLDEHYGIMIKVTTDLAAREALELWLGLVEGLAREKYKIPLAVEWIGEKNVSQDEMIDYIVKIMIKSGLGPKALSGFEAISAVREARKE